MGKYRNRTTGEIKTQGQWRANNPNMSLPKIWKAATLDGLDLEPVLSGEIPSLGAYQRPILDGATQNENGDWVENFIAEDIFADDEDGTKEDKEANYQTILDAAASESNRRIRDTKLTETDFYALSDVTMSEEITTYRQALRDITNHANWPNLEEADWPVAP